MTKQHAYNLIQDDKAIFINECNVGKDGWEQTYEAEGHRIKICAIGDDRWLFDDVDSIIIEKIWLFYLTLIDSFGILSLWIKTSSANNTVIAAAQTVQ